MFIQTEETPNPSTLKFIPGVQVLNEGTVEFKDKKSAQISNLAHFIFSIDGQGTNFAEPPVLLNLVELNPEIEPPPE